MTDYRDYGAVYNETAPLIPVDTIKRTQVWLATHDGAGNRLPHRYRSFISFSFGGRWIEDFELIAYCNGDTMNRPGSAEFEDLTTSYDIMDGLYYHGTHFKPYTLSLDLVSDAIDLQKLEDFLQWFSGGKTRELILAEHPYRAMLARVSEPPQVEMTPFELKITMTINNLQFSTSTTVYRGMISLKFVSDMPFWYSLLNFLIGNSSLANTNAGLFNGIILKYNYTINDMPSGTTEAQYLAALASSREIYPEAVKIAYEDNIPLSPMVKQTMHFGMPRYVLVDPTILPGEDPPPDYNKSIPTEIGVPSNLSPNADIYPLFYGGTAPSPTQTIFMMSLKPLGESGYIDCIANSYVPVDNKDYSTITVISEHTKEFDFTTPNIITSWNKVYKMFNDIEVRTLVTGTNDYTGTNWKDLADNLRDYIRHNAVRTYAIHLINYILAHNDNYINTDDGIFLLAGKDFCILMLTKFFLKYTWHDGEDWDSSENWSYSNENVIDRRATFDFNAETGEAYGTFYYWECRYGATNIIEAMMEFFETAHAGEDDAADIANPNLKATFHSHTEDIGDMMRSNWLFLEDRNYSVNDEIYQWSVSSPRNAHKVTHNAPGKLQVFRIQYKNRYL